MKTNSRNNHEPAKRFTLLKRQAEADGIPYSSSRDAVFRGELPVLKLGRSEKYSRWYVDQADWQRWIQSRKGA